MAEPFAIVTVKLDDEQVQSLIATWREAFAEQERTSAELLAAAISRAERAERSRDKLRLQCGQFWMHWKLNEARAARAERSRDKLRRIVRLYWDIYTRPQLRQKRREEARE